MCKKLSLLAAIFSLMFLNSCAVPASLIGGGGTLYALHKEARTHYPDKVPALPELPNFSIFFNSQADSNSRESTAGTDRGFGFDCTKENNKEQSKCFDRFMKSLSEGEDHIKTNQHSNPVKSNSAAAIQNKLIPHGPRQTKKQRINQIPRNNPEASNWETRHQGINSATPKFKQTIQFIDSHLLKWVKAWEKQDINKYISFYSKNFIGAKRNHQEWETHRYRALKVNTNMSIQLSHIHLYKNKETIEVNFIQNYKSDSFADVGIKELIWGKHGNRWEIIKETWMPTEKTTLINNNDHPKDFISSQLFKWINSWANQDINTYISFYSKDFMGMKKSRSEWEAHRYHALTYNSGMSIKVSDIQLHKNDDFIEINFTQRFQSDRFSDIGLKRLVWKKMEGRWKIFDEMWIPS